MYHFAKASRILSIDADFLQAEAETRGVHAGVFLHQDHLEQPVGAGAAVGLGHRGAQKAGRARLAPDFAVHVALRLPGGMERHHLALEEAAVRIAEGFVVLVEQCAGDRHVGILGVGHS